MHLHLSPVIVLSDIDECASDPCQNGATCIDKVNEFTCDCGYSCPCANVVAGKLCEKSKYSDREKSDCHLLTFPCECQSVCLVLWYCFLEDELL